MVGNERLEAQEQANASRTVGVECWSFFGSPASEMCASFFGFVNFRLGVLATTSLDSVGQCSTPGTNLCISSERNNKAVKRPRSEWKKLETKMPLPRYSLDDGGDGDEDTFEESYTSAASASRLPGSSISNQARASTSFSQTPSVAGERSFSPSLSAYDAPSSLDVDALLESTPSSHLKPTHSRQPQPPPSSTGWPYSTTSPLARLTPFEQLTHFMSTQKASPELLPFPTTPFDSLVGQMEQQQSILDSLLHLSTASMPMDGEDAEGGGEGVGGGVDEDEYLRLNLVQVDLERCKWLLKQILRIRMDLLQKYAGFVVGRTGERRKLNDAEAKFVNE